MKNLMNPQQHIFAKVFGRNTFHSQTGRQYIEYYIDNGEKNPSISFAHWNQDKKIESYNNGLVLQFLGKFFPYVSSNTFLKALFDISNGSGTPISFNIDSSEHLSLRVLTTPILKDFLEQQDKELFNSFFSVFSQETPPSFFEFDFLTIQNSSSPITLRSYHRKENAQLSNLPSILDLYKDNIDSVSDVYEYSKEKQNKYTLVKFTNTINSSYFHKKHTDIQDNLAITFYQEQLGNQDNFRLYFIK